MKLKYFILFLLILEICTIGVILIIVGAMGKACLSFRIYLEESILINYNMYKTQFLNILRGKK